MLKVIILWGLDDPQVCAIERLTPTDRIRWTAGQGPVGSAPWARDNRPRPVAENVTAYQFSGEIYPYDENHLSALALLQGARRAARARLQAAQAAHEADVQAARDACGLTPITARDLIAEFQGTR